MVLEFLFHSTKRPSSLCSDHHYQQSTNNHSAMPPTGKRKRNATYSRGSAGQTSRSTRGRNTQKKKIPAPRQIDISNGIPPESEAYFGCAYCPNIGFASTDDLKMHIDLMKESNDRSERDDHSRKKHERAVSCLVCSPTTNFSQNMQLPRRRKFFAAFSALNGHASSKDHIVYLKAREEARANAGRCPTIVLADLDNSSMFSAPNPNPHAASDGDDDLESAMPFPDEEEVDEGEVEEEKKEEEEKSEPIVQDKLNVYSSDEEDDRYSPNTEDWQFSEPRALRHFHPDGVPKNLEITRTSPAPPSNQTNRLFGLGSTLRDTPTRDNSVDLHNDDASAGGDLGEEETPQPDDEQTDLGHQPNLEEVNNTNGQATSLPLAKFARTKQKWGKFEEIAVKLQNILDRSCAPASMFNDIMNWAVESSTSEGFDFAKDVTNDRRTFMKRLVARHKPVQPVTRTVNLETPQVSEGHHVEGTTGVIYWPFEESFRDFIADPNLFGQEANLVLNAANRFYPNEAVGSGPVEEIVHARWMKDTIECYKDLYDFDPELDFIHPIVLTQDKTSESTNTRFGLEPILFGSAILRRKVRNRPHSWRYLGLVPDIEYESRQHKKRMDKADKNNRGRNMRNYHKVISTIFESLVAYQKKTNVKRSQFKKEDAIPMTIGSETVVRRVFAPVAFLIGDGKNADVAACRMHHCGAFNNRRIENGVDKAFQLSSFFLGSDSPGGNDDSLANDGTTSSGRRSSRATSSNPFFVREDIDNLTDDEEDDESVAQGTAKERLSQLLHGRIGRGCTCRPDQAGTVHAGNNKTVSMARMDKLCRPLDPFVVRTAVDVVLGKVQPQQPFPSKVDAEDFLEAISHHPVQSAYDKLDFGANPSGLFGALPTDPMHAFSEGLLKYLTKIFFEKIIGPTGSAELDRVAIDHFQKNSPRQAGRSLYPRTSFSGGLTKTTMLAAHEYGGISLVLSLILHSEDFEKEKLVKSGKTGCSVSDYQEIFADLLSFLCWLSDGPFPSSDDDLAITRNGINKLLLKIVNRFPRNVKNGWRLQKLHDMSHLWWYIKMFGSPQNFDNAPTEHNHKETKNHGRRSLHFDDETYRKGTANRVTEKAALLKANSSLLEFHGEEVPQPEPHELCNMQIRSISLSRVPYCVVVYDADAAVEKVLAFPVCRKTSKVLLQPDEGVINPSVLEYLENSMQKSMEAGKGWNATLLFDECYHHLTADVSQRSQATAQTKRTYRATERYNGGGPWYDWVLSDWQLEDNVAEFTERHKPGAQQLPAIHRPTILHDTRQNGKLYRRSRGVVMENGDTRYGAYSCPSRVLGFVLRCSIDKTRCSSAEQVIQTFNPFIKALKATQDVRKLSSNLIYDEDIAPPGVKGDSATPEYTCVIPAKAILHTSLSEPAKKRGIGFEFEMECNKPPKDKPPRGQRSIAKVGWVPVFRLTSLSDIHQIIFCYEFGQKPRPYYRDEKKPRIVMVQPWKCGLSHNFKQKYLKGWCS